MIRSRLLSKPATVPYTLNTDNILNRMKEVLHARNDAELARFLGVEASTIATWKRRETIPWEMCSRLYEEHGTDLNWLLYGQPSLEHTYLYPPVCTLCPPQDRGGLDLLADEAWVSGHNRAIHPGGTSFHVVAVKNDDMVKRRPMITVPQVDDSMAPTITYNATATVALILPEVGEEFDYAQLHGRLVCVLAGTWETGGELVLKRLVKIGSGAYNLTCDNPVWTSFEFMRDGRLNQYWRLAGEVMAVMNLVDRSL